MIALLIFTGTDCKKDGDIIIPPDTTKPPVVDTTSHNFTWTQFTFGGDAGSSVLYDVAIVNDSLIYAVGEIIVRDSAGNVKNPPYNIARWDGKQWILETLNFEFENGTLYATAHAIIAFAADDIFISSGSSIMHWDGNSWKNVGILYSNGISIGNVLRFWGTSSNNLYGVGRSGSIVHYNGSPNGAGTWSKLESGTTLDVQDIWGAKNETTGEYEVLAVASQRFQNVGKKILQINGTIVTSLPDSGLSWSLSSVWFVAGKKYYVVGGGIYEKNILDNSVWVDKASEITTYYPFSIRGNAPNDIVTAGGGGEILHYNGKSWQSYYSQTKVASGNYYSVAIKNNIVVAVGQDNPKAMITVGIKIK